MWIRALLVGLLIGLVFIAFSINAQPRQEESFVIKKLDEILKNQEDMLRHLKFIRNKV